MIDDQSKKLFPKLLKPALGTEMTHHVGTYQTGTAAPKP